MPVSSYQKMQTQVASSRDIEYAAFGKATQGLIDAAASGHEDLKKLITAIDFNRQLWTTLAIDCTNDKNALPAGLRSNIVQLARFVSEHSSQVMRRTEDLGPLIEINRMIMDGLAGSASKA